MGGQGLGIIFVVLSYFLHLISCASPALDYGIMIDAGSSGSRVYVYEWPHRVSKSVPLVAPYLINQKVVLYETRDPLSGYANNLSYAGPSLAPLINYVKDNLPQNVWAITPIYVKATAGMRALSQTDQDNIMTKVRSWLDTETPFEFDPTSEAAAVIPGSYEGVYGWITTNYATQLLQTYSSDSVGALDMGGASTQITFVPSSPPDQFNFTLPIANMSYDLYAYSYSLGQDVSLNLLLSGLLADNITDANGNLQNPCYLTGYTETFTTTVQSSTVSVKVTGTSDYVSCSAAIDKYIAQKGSCSNCGMRGVYQPAIFSGTYYGFSGYAYTSNFFGLNDTVTPRQISTAASQFCARTWSDATTTWPNATARFLKAYCFNGAYLHAALTDYGFPEDATNLKILRTIGNIELTWALGAMINEANLLPIGLANTTGTTTTNAATSNFGILTSLFIILFMAVIL